MSKGYRPERGFLFAMTNSLQGYNESITDLNNISDKISNVTPRDPSNAQSTIGRITQSPVIGGHSVSHHRARAVSHQLFRQTTIQKTDRFGMQPGVRCDGCLGSHVVKARAFSQSIDSLDPSTRSYILLTMRAVSMVIHVNTIRTR